MSDFTTTPRVCPKCEQEFPRTPEYWHRDKSTADGLRAVCKQCASAKARQWNRDNKERAGARKEAWRQHNRERLRARERERNARRRAEYNEYHSRYRNANRERVNEIQREYERRNPMKRRVHQYVRRERKQNAGKLTPVDIRNQYASQKGKCWWCGKKVGDDYHVDHVIPLSRGGTNDPRNIVIACPKCNLKKGPKTPAEFAGRLF